MVAMIVLLVVAVMGLAVGVRLLEPRLAFFPFAGEDVTPRQFGVEFSGSTLVTADGERLRAWHLPRPDALAQIVYFHGNGGNLSIWTDVLVGLWRERYDVVALDYRGYGLSTGKPTEPGLYRDVEAIISHVETLRRADLPLIYWGRSLGTAMAGYAATRGRPDAVILEAGFPSARALFDRNPVMRVLSAFATYRFATAEWMANVRLPTLVIHGDRDSVIPFRHGQRLYDALPGPKRFVAIPGGDHNDPAPADAALYWSAVREFVASLR